MKKLMPVALLVMVMIAAPVLAQETTGLDTSGSAPPGESPETAPDPETPPAPETPSALETLLQNIPLLQDTAAPQEPPPQELPPQDTTPPQDTAPPLSEPEPAPDPPPQAPPQTAVLPEVPQEVVEDKKADDGDALEPGPENLETIISALAKEADEQEADDDEAEQVDEEDLDAIADLRQRLGDLKSDLVSPKQRQKAQDDDDDRPGRNDDDDEDEDKDGRGGIGQDNDQEAESGDIDQSIDVSNSGDFAQQCVAVIQAANTGNAQNAPAFLQYSGEADDFEPGGIEIDISPQLVQDCRQIIRQTTVVNQLSPRAGQPRAGRPGVVGATGTPPRIAGAGFSAAGSGGRAIANASRLGQQAGGIGQARNIAQPRIQQLNSAPTTARRLGQLPRTGGPGVISLLTLGAVLISGGLLVRRLSR